MVHISEDNLSTLEQDTSWLCKGAKLVRRMWSEHLVSCKLIVLLFGTLQKTLSLKIMWEVIVACVIMHNMIVEDGRERAQQL
jgi:hypothetical protein